MKAIVADRLAILTRYFPNTGSTLATTEGGRRFALPYNGSSGDARHAAACEGLCAKLGWTADMVGNQFPDDTNRYLWMVKP